MGIILNQTFAGAGTTNGTALTPPRNVAGASFLLNLTAAATDVGDTFDVYVQSSEDAGTTWNDFVHFTQMLGNGGAKKFVAKWNGLQAPTTALGPNKDGTLAVGVEQGPAGALWRTKAVIVDANANSSFAVVLSVDFLYSSNERNS